MPATCDSLPESPFLHSSGFPWSTGDILHEIWRVAVKYLLHSRHMQKPVPGCSSRTLTLTGRRRWREVTSRPDTARSPPSASPTPGKVPLASVRKGARGSCRSSTSLKLTCKQGETPVVPLHLCRSQPSLTVPVGAYSLLFVVHLSS